MSDKMTPFQFSLAGYPLTTPSYPVTEPPSDVRCKDTPAPKPQSTEAPALHAHKHLYQLTVAPKNLSGFFKPYALSTAPHVRLYESKDPSSIFSCEIGDSVGVLTKGTLTSTFTVSGVAIDFSPRQIPDHNLQVMAPVATNDGQLLWQAYSQGGLQARASQLVWVVGDVPINPRKLIGALDPSKPLNDFEKLLRPAFDHLTTTPHSKNTATLVKKEWSKLLLDLQTSDSGKLLLRNKTVMTGIHAALYKVAGFDADNIPTKP